MGQIIEPTSEFQERPLAKQEATNYPLAEVGNLIDLETDASSKSSNSQSNNFDWFNFGKETNI